ncbi:MAG: ABC-type multidrug transport system, ATPase and permease component [Firmicutes bacterium]|nr:ABC-type multidrug transport system, ATPase and permease component [Bacillota bacterium]
MEGRRFGGPPKGLILEAKPHNLKGTVKRLWKYFGNERKILILMFLLSILETAIGLAVPFGLGRAVDAISLTKESVNFSLLGIIIFLLLAALVTDALITFIQSWLVAGVSQRIVRSFRSSLFSKLQKLPIAFFDKSTHGDLMSRLTNDIDNVSITISQSTVQLIGGFMMVLGSLVMMLFLSPFLTLAAVATLPLSFLMTRLIAARTAPLYKKQQAELGMLDGHLEETISGLRVIKAFNHEDEVIAQFEALNQRLLAVGLKAQIWSGYLFPLMNIINNLTIAIVALTGGLLAIDGAITVGVITSFIGYSRQFSRPLSEFANIFNTLQSAAAGAERVFDIIDEKEEERDVRAARELSNPKGDVVFENVSFYYREDVPVIRDVSFEVKSGSSIAIVGPTGAGKTTIVNLLARFYDVTAGRILIDGTDIREYSRDSLRKCFGIVLQETYLFSGTIKDNIKYGNPAATDEEVVKAAQIANAHRFISRMPDGYDTVLSESGSNLSQGQKQLLAIARAVLVNPSILILDEATSSVDTRTEFNIQKAMLNIMRGRTSFIIAHRLSTIRDADTIIVIDNGEIAERGNHESLLQQKGVYYRLYFSQLTKA